MTDFKVCSINLPWLNEGITIDILDYVNKSDVIVLASGDGDFDLLAAKVKNDYSVIFEVYGVQDLTATSLIENASKYIPIKGSLLLQNQDRQ